MIQVKVCYELVCDRDCNGRGWDDSTPHFDTRDEAVAYARSAGFVVVGDRALCQSCAADADCEATGHQWDEWDEWDDKTLYGVAYRHRWCAHCGAGGYDPPAAELGVLLDAARIVNGDQL